MDVRSHGVLLDVWNFINGAIVYGARATRPRQEWVQFPRNPFYGPVAQLVVAVD